MAMATLPFLLNYLQLNFIQGSFLTGASLHSVGHVVAVASTVGEKVGVLATAVKLARVSMLIPVL